MKILFTFLTEKKTVWTNKKFVYLIIVIASQNNVRKYRTKGHEQVYSKDFLESSVHFKWLNEINRKILLLAESNNLSLILTLLRVTGEFQREWQSAEHVRARLGRGVNQEMIHILLFYLFLLFSCDDRFMRGDLEKQYCKKK